MTQDAVSPDLAGKVVAVIVCSRIGEAIDRAFACQDSRVGVLDIDVAASERLVPDDVARFAVFPASAEACANQHPVVDGGWT
ncbi:MAG: hypothetical protein ACOYOJ_12855 [Alsobacter sp.]